MKKKHLLYPSIAGLGISGAGLGLGLFVQDTTASVMGLLLVIIFAEMLYISLED